MLIALDLVSDACFCIRSHAKHFYCRWAWVFATKTFHLFLPSRLSHALMHKHRLKLRNIACMEEMLDHNLLQKCPFLSRTLGEYATATRWQFHSIFRGHLKFFSKNCAEWILKFVIWQYAVFLNSFFLMSVCWLATLVRTWGSSLSIFPITILSYVFISWFSSRYIDLYYQYGSYCMSIIN